jgi:hypothetical protein
MVRHPLEHGIAKQEISALFRHPSRKITLYKFIAWQPLARLPQHIQRRVDPHDFRAGKPLDKQSPAV